MKKVFLKISLIALMAGLGLTSCKKNEVEPDYSEISQQSSDNSNVQRESDQAMDDATKLLEGSSLSQRIDASSVSFDVDSSQMENGKKKFIMKYKGNSLNGKMRSGKVSAVLTKGLRWSDKDAEMTLTFDTMKVTRNGKTITFNGTKVITNKTGGRAYFINAGDSVVHNVDATGLKITFEDGATRTWDVSKSRTFKKDGSGNFTVTVRGTGLNGLSEKGTSRKGSYFRTLILTPIVYSNCSDDPKPISGVKKHTGIVRDATVTFGVDSNGNAVNSCDATSFKINWVNRKGESQQNIVNY